MMRPTDDRRIPVFLEIASTAHLADLTQGRHKDTHSRQYAQFVVYRAKLG